MLLVRLYSERKPETRKERVRGCSTAYDDDKIIYIINISLGGVFE